MVGPKKFRIGNYIYLMVAYIEYIWLKKKSGRSNQSFVVLVKIAGKGNVAQMLAIIMSKDLKHELVIQAGQWN